MNDPNVPSLSAIVDQLTARIEWAETQGQVDERAALNAAREAILAHVFAEYRNRSLIATIRARLFRRYAA